LPVQRRVERKLKGLIYLPTYRSEASAEFVLLSKPHEGRRWRHHSVASTKLKKEMWAETLIRNIRLRHSYEGPATASRAMRPMRLYMKLT
jgi:hypothetical protein